MPLGIFTPTSHGQPNVGKPDKMIPGHPKIFHEPKAI
jgi:hypothetical protein